MNFWIATGALLALALLLLLTPLLRGLRQPQDDQRRQQNIGIAREKKQQLDAQLEQGEIDRGEYDAAYADLQTALALELEGGHGQISDGRGRWMALPVLIAVPLLTVLLYLAVGEYRVVANPQLAQAPAAGAEGAAPQMTLEEMEAAIQQRLRDTPDDAEGWFMLGRTYMGMQDFDRAVAAYQRSNDLAPDEAGILIALADALAMQAGGVLEGEPEQLILRGLDLAPDFSNGLWLAGLAAEQRGDLVTAHSYWSRLLPLVAGNAQSTREVMEMLGNLEDRDPSLYSAAAAPGRELSLKVDIDAELRARTTAETAVFVFARALQGPPMPLAVKKLSVADLPATVTLSDADAMLPTMKLSAHPAVVVGARVSFSGNPVAQPGDFYTEFTPGADADDGPIRLLIDSVK